MGMYDDDGFGYDDDEREQGPKALREARAAAVKRARELEAQVAKLSEQLAARNLKDVLAEKGLRPGLARVISREDVDTTDAAAIEAWLSSPENQEDFGFSLEADASTDGGEEGGSEEEQDPVAAEYQRMQDASSGAMPTSRFQEAEAQIRKAGAKAGPDGNLAEIQAALDMALKSTPSKE